MAMLLSGLGAVCGLVAFVCYIIVLVKMFQNGQIGLGIAAIVLLCCFGIGHIVALVVGWQNAGRWAIRQLMMVYSISLGLGIVLSGIGQAMGGQLIVIQR